MFAIISGWCADPLSCKRVWSLVVLEGTWPSDFDSERVDPLLSLSCKPIPPNILGVPFHSPNFGGGVSETPCFAVFSGGRPLNFGGEIVTP